MSPEQFMSYTLWLLIGLFLIIGITSWIYNKIAEKKEMAK